MGVCRKFGDWFWRLGDLEKLLGSQVSTYSHKAREKRE